MIEEQEQESNYFAKFNDENKFKENINQPNQQKNGGIKMKNNIQKESKSLTVRPDVLPNSQYYKEEISMNWQKSVEGILRVAKLLSEGQKDLEKEDWQNLIHNELPFTSSIAYKLMKIGKDSRLMNPAHVPLLPVSYATLHEFSKLTDEEFDKAKETGILNPKVQRKDVTKFKREERGIDNPKTEVISSENKKFVQIFVDPERADFGQIEQRLNDALDGLDGVRFEYTNLFNQLQKQQELQMNKWVHEEFVIPARRALNDFVKDKRKELKKLKTKQSPHLGKKFSEIGWGEIDDMLEFRINSLDVNELENYLAMFQLDDSVSMKNNQPHRNAA